MAITVATPASVAKIVGTWTHTNGSANESITISGKVWSAVFSQNLSSAPVEVDIKWSDSLSGLVSTITVYCNATVTDGRFVIHYTPC